MTGVSDVTACRWVHGTRSASLIVNTGVSDTTVATVAAPAGVKSWTLPSAGIQACAAAMADRCFQWLLHAARGRPRFASQRYDDDIQSHTGEP